MEIDDNIIATTERAKEIKAIDRTSVHKICSGQVVLTLAVAVKELLENAIDAGATTVEIRLKNSGRDLIEVVDNGQGVEEHNFQALTLKHHTSKIQDFNDLLNVTTFGFRGEALSSLCALSKLAVITRHKSAECAYNIQYDKNGKIINKTRCARSIGTTVILENLFSPLAVRHKEFHKNIKREYTKMCNLLYAYCLISTGVKIVCTNTNNKNIKSIVASTQENNSIKDNISCIFGHEQFASIVEFEQVKPTPAICEEYNIKDVPDDVPFSIIGYISKGKPGSGRGTSDRQFYYINSRPCEIPKLSRVTNDVYHQFNNSQYPFVLFNIKIRTTMVDVNVTPDKRKLFMENENILLATVKSSLLNMFKQNITCFDTSSSTLLDETRSRGLKRSFVEQTSMKSFVMRTLLEKRMKISDDKVENLSEMSSDEEIEPKVKKNTTLQEDLMKNNVEYPSCNIKIEKSKEQIVSIEKIKEEISQEIEFPACVPHVHVEKERLADVVETFSKTEEAVNIESKLSECKSVIPKKLIEILEIKNRTTIDQFESDVSSEGEEIEHEEMEVPDLKEDDNKSDSKDLEYDSTQIPTREAISISTTMEDIRQRLIERQELSKTSGEKCIKFRAEINPLSNKNAEKELEREIKKDMFKKMDIIGQFNMGFIIAKLDNDLFIIDQHATDEKYNFEVLQQTTILQRQKLVVPQKLELTTANKALIVDNLEIFKKNGFMFKIENSESAQEICLTEVPLSKNFCMGKDDVDDLLFMLQDGSQQMCRPTRIRSMFALRACRKSVMVGDALSQQDMKRLVDHMGEIEHPWNCPHGRPTMRHLINLSLLDTENS